MYHIEDLEDGSGIKIISGSGEAVCELRGGNVPMICGVYGNLLRQDAQRADAFLHGIVLAMVHCSLMNVVPDVRAL